MDVEKLVQLSSIKHIVVDAILALDKKPDKHGNYPYLHVSTSDNNVMFVYMCPIMKNKYIVYEMCRMCNLPPIVNTRHMDLETVKRYVRCLTSITYVAITDRKTHLDTMKILYEQQ
jgi:hypothetical protein